MLRIAGIDSALHIAGIDSTLHTAGIDSAVHKAGIDSALHIAGIDSTLQIVGIDSLLHIADIESTLHKDDINSMLHKVGIDSLLVMSIQFQFRNTYVASFPNVKKMGPDKQCRTRSYSHKSKYIPTSRLRVIAIVQVSLHMLSFAHWVIFKPFCCPPTFF